MQVTIDGLEAYLQKLYGGKVTEQGLFMKLVEEMGEVAEALNKRTGRKASDGSDLRSELGEELARVSGYTLADVPYESGFAGYKDWFIQTFRRPGYTIEAGLGENPLPISQFDSIYRDNLGILVTAALGLPGGA